MSRFLASTSVTAGTLSHEKLRKSPFFADCDAAFLTRLIKDLSVELFTTNEMIMKKGEHADKMYYLMMGEVEILLGNNVRVAKLQEGTVFGEMAMFNHLGNGFSRRSATIRALNFCDTRVINKDRFHAILKQHPKERERFEKIAQERKTKLEKSKDILRPEGPQLRPVAPNSNAASQAVKLKALLGRRASLPVDWANGRAKAGDDFQGPLPTPLAMKDDPLDRPFLQSSMTQGAFTMDLAKTLPTPAALAAATIAAEHRCDSDGDSQSSSSDSGLESVEEISVGDLMSQPPTPSRPSSRLGKVVRCPEGRRPRVASLLVAFKEVAEPGSGGRSSPKRCKRSPELSLSPLAEMLRRPRPEMPEAITRSNDWTAAGKAAEKEPEHRTAKPRRSCLRSAQRSRRGSEAKEEWK